MLQHHKAGHSQILAMGFMILAAFLGAVGQLIMKQAAMLMRADGVTLWVAFAATGAFCLYGIVMLLFLQGLRHGRELSTTYPVYSLTFPFAAVLAWVFYGEVFEPIQWLGLLSICTGVGVMNLPKSRKQRLFPREVAR